jgi:hypothetical protein
MLEKPTQLKTKTIGGMVYSDDTVGVFQMKNELPNCDITLTDTKDINLLIEWLIDVAKYLEDKK